jgi:hypothetical protein
MTKLSATMTTAKFGRDRTETARLRRFVLLLALVGLAAPSVSTAVQQSCEHHDAAAEEAWHFATVEPEIRARRDRILRELDSGKAGAWAGWYSSYHGETTSTGLLWAPESGYLQFVARDNPSLDDVSYGRVAMEGNIVRLLPEIPIGKDVYSFNTLYGEFLAVRWGSGRYLVARDRLVRFCDAVVSGDRSEVAQFLGIDRGRDWPPAGKPDVPDEYRKYLEARPIVARVKSISQSRTEQDVTYDRIVLSAGSADGVRAEMKFWLHRPRRRTFEYLELRIKSVDRHTSEAVIESIPFDPEAQEYLNPKPGWSFRNRLPKSS